MVVLVSVCVVVIVGVLVVTRRSGVEKTQSECLPVVSAFSVLHLPSAENTTSTPVIRTHGAGCKRPIPHMKRRC